MSDEEGVPIQIETHRNCITNDLLTTLCLLEDVPQMRLCADLSHYVVGREMSFPIPQASLDQISEVLARSDSFQGRVAGRQQIQLPLHFTQSQKWVELFKSWWLEGFQSWQARNPSGQCHFVCELGPPDYALTDAQGREFSDRWDEALTLRTWAQEIWTAAKSD
ncbi:MAG: sugar phosphate isomerase/epimerase, partial [Pseudomonadota bacterium]